MYNKFRQYIYYFYKRNNYSNNYILDQLQPSAQQLPNGQDAAIIGSIDETASHVVLETEFGGERILEELEDDPLPRICWYR